jgi:hypothetical protein
MGVKIKSKGLRAVPPLTAKRNSPAVAGLFRVCAFKRSKLSIASWADRGADGLDWISLVLATVCEVLHRRWGLTATGPARLRSWWGLARGVWRRFGRRQFKSFRLRLHSGLRQRRSAFGAALYGPTEVGPFLFGGGPCEFGVAWQVRGLRIQARAIYGRGRR